MKKFFRILNGTIVILIFLAFLMFKSNDDTPLEQTDYYYQTMKILAALQPQKGYGSQLKCGWSKKNITPDFKVHIAGYGVRKKDYDSVHDSIFVRTMVFDNGLQKVALVSLDLMIVPPLVVEKVMPQLKQQGFSRGQVYLGATHTHSSAGGWAKGIGGWSLAGPFEQKMIDKVAYAIVSSVKEAVRRQSICSIGFQKIEAGDLVANRLLGDSYPEDPWLRVVKVEKENKETAMLITYSAHATCIEKKDNQVSCDYPGMLAAKMEKEGDCNFATFFAGAVGSMRPTVDSLKGFKRAEVLAEKLQQRIKAHSSELKTDTSSYIESAYLPMLMHEPQLRLNDYLRLRPWLFNALLGKQEIGINLLQLGNILLIGTPCDYSGELVNKNEQLAASKNNKLLITSFNGGYVGYITPDQYYDSVKRAEVREMNWYGPNNGRYFSEVVNGLIVK
ncbi:neutral/alkaline non-lysosomal ceramidase N-terminal domain-containing protein [Solitalea lacus]|uniref:neutral/alkaline non-lysosomal ceramidase N-terminal domain-containing protein n=1 Tax=Solitalea lacus TaxID=2911172 RepID=UPI001EDC773F|nr:neutral/alkaline non-lysosomal ceramidase N-terminal domain-containing protein [Solitalea lacus]UKJ07637.1 neutral/alkaline non-lysosomal ceramidase N-terminal domain-containing protein [Solitalea lacus]